jgi:hypothetical protein
MIKYRSLGYQLLVKEFAMKYILCLFALLLGLAACTPAVATPAPIVMRIPTTTETPVPSPTDTLKPTGTFPPTSTFIPSETATPDISKYTVLSKTLDQFPEGQKTDIAGIKSALLASPSLLSPNAKPVDIGVIVTLSNGNKYFTVFCNEGGIINCAPRAYLQFTDSINGQTRNPHIIIWEMMTKQGIALISGYSYDPVEIHYTTQFKQFSQNPFGPQDFTFLVGVPPDYLAIDPYMDSLTKQPGYQDAAQALTTSGSLPSDDDQIIFVTPGF